jgi:Domain of unknown function (DUF5666)
MDRRRSGGWRPAAALAVAPLVVGLVAGAVGGVGAAAAASSGSGTPTTQGAFGTVAAIAGTSMEVQNQQTGQVTVGWTSSTAFTQLASVGASSVVAGDCVAVTGSSSKGRLSARSVAILPTPSSGSCTGGPSTGSVPPGSAGPGPVKVSGGAPAGPGGVLPPGGTAVQGAKPPAIAGGKVLSQSGSRLVLSGFSSTAVGKVGGKGGSASGASHRRSARRPSASRRVVTVTLSSSTAYTETQPAAASDLAVGDCVTANGPAAANGSVTAKAVQITATGGKSCTAGSAVRVTGG